MKTKKEIPSALKELGWTNYDKKGSIPRFISPDKRFLIIRSETSWMLQDNNKIGLGNYWNDVLLGRNDELKVLDGLRRIEQTLKTEREIQEGREKMGDYLFDKIHEMENKLRIIEEFISDLRNAL